MFYFLTTIKFCLHQNKEIKSKKKIKNKTKDQHILEAFPSIDLTKKY